MPDGDRVHPRLARPYQKVYKCEGERPLSSLHRQSLTRDALAGKATRQLLSAEAPWDSLARYYPRLMDIIDRTAASERLVPEAMQEQFVLLYRRYVNEWEQVRSQIERGLLGEEELRAAA